MDFVRVFNGRLAERVEQVDIENRIAEVECSKNINESADIGLNNASDSEDEDEFTEKMLDRFYQDKKRNAAAKKIGDMLSKIDWANIKFDEEAAKFVELDPETVRQAINSNKINGLSLVFLRYVLCKIYTKQIQEHSFEYFLAKEMKGKILMERRLLPTLAKFSAKAREICSKECDKRTDKEKEIVDKAWTLYKKVEKLISNIDIINRHLGIIKNGELVINRDCLNFRREIHCLSARYSPDPLGAMRPWAEFPGLYQIDSKVKDIIDKIDERIKPLLSKADFKDLCVQHREITDNIEKINKSFDSI